jgi:hypothetical protein
MTPPTHRDWRGYRELRVDLWSAGGNYYSEGYGMHGDIFCNYSGYGASVGRGLEA